jgi:hypothetical protein
MITATFYAPGLSVEVIDRVLPVDIQQDSTVPDVDWLEGALGTLPVLSHYSSPSGKTLSLAAVGSLPAGVTLSGGGFAYDGTGSFRAGVVVNWDITAA